MSLHSNAFNCPTQEKQSSQSQKWSSPGVSIRMVASHAFSGCRSLTFNITERREVESQVPYMHIWPLANVRGGRSHALLLTLLQGCTVHSIPQLAHRVAIRSAKMHLHLLNQPEFILRLVVKNANISLLQKAESFLRVIIGSALQEIPVGKYFKWTNSKLNTTADFTWSHFWLPKFLNTLPCGAHLTTFKAKQCTDFTVSSMRLRKDVHSLEDTTNTASRPVTQCRWPGSACTQPWNNNCCLVFDVSLGSGRRSSSG